MRRILIALLGSLALGSFAQNAILTVSAGGGIGLLSENFTQSGSPTTLGYLAPGGYIDADIAWGDYYLDMGLSVLFAPLDVRLGTQKVDLSGYEMNLGLDFTAIGIGYLYRLEAVPGLALGGAVGFHVTAPMLTPPNGDYTRLAFEGYYGLLGVTLTPRLRYSLGNSLVLTCSLPLALDFMAMSQDVVVGGVNTGLTSPAVVSPAGLTPAFTGFTAGLCLSMGYQLPIK